MYYKKSLEDEGKETDKLIHSALNIVGWIGLIISIIATDAGILGSLDEIRLNLLKMALLSSIVIMTGLSITTSLSFIIKDKGDNTRHKFTQSIITNSKQPSTDGILGDLIMEIHTDIKEKKEQNKVRMKLIIWV